MLCQQGGAQKKSWEGAQPGKVIQSGQEDIPHLRTSWPVNKLEESPRRGQFEFKDGICHLSAYGEQLYWASHLLLTIIIIIYYDISTSLKLLNCSFPNPQVLLLILVTHWTDDLILEGQVYIIKSIFHCASCPFNEGTTAIKKKTTKQKKPNLIPNSNLFTSLKASFFWYQRQTQYGSERKIFLLSSEQTSRAGSSPCKTLTFLFLVWFGLVFWCSAVVLLRFCEFFGHIHFWIKRSCEKSIAKIKLQSNGLL